MGSFQISRNGYRMYMPSWQQNPGSRMREMNRAASDSYFSNASTLGSNLLGGAVTATAGSVQLTMQIATERVQQQYQAKLAAATSGLDLSI